MNAPAAQRPAREAGFVLGSLVALLLITAAWWALAFWPVQDASGWLARTRYVCFGVRDSGLPDAGGWIGLIAGPLGMLAILLIGWWDGVREVARGARRSRKLGAAVALIGIAGLAIVLGAAVRVDQARTAAFSQGITDDPVPSTYPRLDRVAPQLRLMAHDGNPLDLASFRGRAVLVTFGFAHCTTICPLVVRNTLAAQELLHAEGREVPVLIVTLDPWRDTPSRLEFIARSWSLPINDAWILGGAVDEVNAVLDAWQVPRTRDALTGDVTHPSLVYVIDADGRIAFATSGGTNAIASLVRRL